jgi:hypothetical protein
MRRVNEHTPLDTGTAEERERKRGSRQSKRQLALSCRGKVASEWREVKEKRAKTLRENGPLGKVRRYFTVFVPKFCEWLQKGMKRDLS